MEIFDHGFHEYHGLEFLFCGYLKSVVRIKYLRPLGINLGLEQLSDNAGREDGCAGGDRQRRGADGRGG